MTRLDEYVGRLEISMLTGLSPRGVERRLQAGVVQVFRDPLDHRRRLIHRDDVARLVMVEPVRRRADAVELTAV